MTRLRELLKPVWEGFDKKGQRRQGMQDSLQRAWQLEQPPMLIEAVERFRQPLMKNGVQAKEMELAGESLAIDLGGEGSIQQGGIEYWPYFCQSGFKRGVTFPREAAQLAKRKSGKTGCSVGMELQGRNSCRPYPPCIETVPFLQRVRKWKNSHGR